MIEPVTINLQILSGDLDLPQKQVQTVVTLLDEGCPIPFIARYRKDITDNLDEDKIRFVASKLRLARSLAERKQSILKAIDALGELSPELDQKIRETQNIKLLEDIYLPYKPKKQTLASSARTRGLTELATEIIEEKIDPENLDERAAAFINEDKKIKSIADAILGAGHIVAEILSEKINLIQKIRELLRTDGKLVTKKIEQELPQNTTTESEQTIPNPAENITESEPELESESENIEQHQTDTAADSDDSNNSNESEVDAVVENVAENVAENIADNETKDSDKLEQDNDDNKPVAEIETEVEAEKKSETETDDNIEAENKIETSASNEEKEDEKKIDSELQSDAESEAKVESDADAASEITEQFLELREAIVGEVMTSAQSKIAAGKDKHRQKIKEDLKRRRKEAKVREREHLGRQFADFFDYSCSAGDIPAYRILAFNRGEREKILRVSIEVDEGKIFDAVRDLVVPSDHKFADFLSGCLRDAIRRILVPSLIRELRLDMTSYAEEHAARISARNLHSLLLQPPLNNTRVLAIDPGFKHGSKVVALDEFGNVLGYETVYFSGGAERKANVIKKLAGTIERKKISVIAIGSGSGSREVEIMMSRLISEYFDGKSKKEVAYVLVNEAGVGTYAASSAAREEFPHYDLPLRRAISIGRRLQNPLNEIAKIDVESLGVGMYQQDIKVKHLREVLVDVVESCVNFVGVDVNTATPSILRYVAGLNKFTARRIYDYRLEHGHFRSREELVKIGGIGGITFTGCAGFLKVFDGDNPLDATWIHPENYHVAVSVIEKFGFNLNDLKLADKRRELAGKIGESNIQELAVKYSAELGAGVYTVTDILTQLTKWDGDPRELLPKPIFKRSVLRFEDLRVEMELIGTVSNVVEFGAFVDVGLQDPGLVHISQISNRYIRDAYDRVAVGDIVRVWITELDEKRRRISLTMLPPGTVREARRGGVAAEGEVAGSTGERRQLPTQRREPRGRFDSSNRSGNVNGNGNTNGNGNVNGNVRAAANVVGKPNGEHSEGGGNIAGNSQVDRSGSVVQRGQRDRFVRQDQRPRASAQSGSRDVAPRSNTSGQSQGQGQGQGQRQNTERSRDRGQDNSGRFNRSDRVSDFRGKYPKTYVSATKPSELKPITEKMKQGKEPLRSFGDLAQFLGRVQVTDSPETKRQKKESVPQKQNNPTNELKEPVENNELVNG
ncbi:MAG: helix-hairpin-helix domain-containing protein [Planctomycetaceae bacterium]|nr:helix-hairpin-helix domain-containing protein [Planctomycetaceae bacterium]